MTRYANQAAYDAAVAKYGREGANYPSLRNNAGPKRPIKTGVRPAYGKPKPAFLGGPGAGPKRPMVQPGVPSGPRSPRGYGPNDGGPMPVRGGIGGVKGPLPPRTGPFAPSYAAPPPPSKPGGALPPRGYGPTDGPGLSLPKGMTKEEAMSARAAEAAATAGRQPQQTSVGFTALKKGGAVKSKAMRGGGLARKGVGMALAKGGLARRAGGCAKRGVGRGKMV